MSEKIKDSLEGVNSESRRHFLTAFPGRILASIGLVAGVKNAMAQVLCEEVKGTATFLAEACEEKIDDPEIRMEFLEGLRSAPAFEEFALKLPDMVNLSGRSLVCLYPAAGSHIAPLLLATKLIDAGVIDSAEYRYTEINDCMLIALEQNLQTFAKVHPDFSFQAHNKQNVCGEYGEIRIFILSYKGHPITIRFLLRCTYGDQLAEPSNLSHRRFMRTEDTDNVHVVISHDSVNNDSTGPTYLFYEWLSHFGLLQHAYASLPAQEGNLPVFIMEDMTAVIRSGRRVDLELLGSLIPSAHPYGHREQRKFMLAHFSRLRECRLMQGRDESVWESTMEKWRRVGAPRKYMDSRAETEESSFRGTLLKPHVALVDLSPDMVALIIEVSLLAKFRSWGGWKGLINGILKKKERDTRPRLKATSADDRLPDGSQKFVIEEGELRSANVCSDLFDNPANLEKIIDTLKKIHPLIAAGFACRVLQAAIALTKNIFEFFATNKSAAFGKVYSVISRMYPLIATSLPEAGDKLKEIASIIEEWLRKIESGVTEINPVMKWAGKNEALREAFKTLDDLGNQCFEKYRQNPTL